LEGVEAVIQRQQGVPAKGHDDSLLLRAQNRGMPQFRPPGGVLDKATPAPLSDGLRIDAVALRKL